MFKTSLNVTKIQVKFQEMLNKNKYFKATNYFVNK